MSDHKFCHLHLHTQFSLLDASTQISPLIDRVAQLGMPAVAVTDHGNMFGAVEFYKAAKKKEVKPIIGVEAYVVPDDHREKTPRQRYTHLVLLAQNEKGYRSLCRLVSASYVHGFYRRPRMDLKLLEQYNEGLIALSACLRGPLNDHLVKDREDVAIEEAIRLANIFKPEDPLRPTETARFFVELQDHGISLQHKCNGGLRDIANKLGLPLVITNDSHYLCEGDKDFRAHEVLLCIGQGKSINDPDWKSVYNENFYVKPPEEMYKLFPNDHEALANTFHIAERCNFKWKFGDYRFPIYTRPGQENVQIDYNEEMCNIAREGLDKRLERLIPLWVERKKLSADEVHERVQKYKARLEEELACILKMGFAGYFLIVQDFINWAKSQDIPVGPGRGSAAGSLAAYAMRITDIDPVEYDLLFQRFLNPERISMPDVDVDFCMRRREEVIRYVHRRYGGDDKVCQIVTFGKMLARGVIKDVGRVMGLPFSDVDKLSKMVPEVLGIKLKDAIAQESRFADMARENPKVADLLEYAQRLEGVARHTSMHAAGVVICDIDLADVVPLYRIGDEGVVTQYDMKGSESIGLIKFDFLGLKTLDQIQYASQMVNEKLKREGKLKADEKFLIDEIPLDDRPTYKLLQEGDTVGVFQLESSGMRELVIKLKPSTIEDVIALVALYRPGPLQSGMVDDFVDRKHGRKDVSYPFPQLEPILNNTYGVIVYQEQVMMLASALANYSLGEADLLRRAMGKKDAAEMARQKSRFLDGCKQNSLDLKKAEDLFDLVAKFAEYGFNKSHSAAYGYLAYQTAFLKANYRAEFFASLLSIESDNTDKVLQYTTDARDAGLEVLKPDINKSDKYFTVVDGKILYGLVALKGVGEGAVDAIVESRKKLKKGGFKNLSHFCEEVDLKRVNKKVIENLIKGGAFDGMGDTRAAMMGGLEIAVDSGASYQKDKSSNQIGLFGAGARTPVKLPALPEWPEGDRLAFEKEALGFYLSGHPMSRYQEELKRITSGSTRDLADLPHEREVTIAGTIASRKVINTKKGDRMAFLTVEDMAGSVEVLVFPKTYAANVELIGEDQDQPIVIKGKLDNSGETPKVLAEEIRLLSAVREERTRRIVFKLDAQKITENQLKDLEKLMRKHAGNVPAEIHFISELEYEVVRTVLPLRKYTLTASEALQADAERLFGQPTAFYQ